MIKITELEGGLKVVSEKVEGFKSVALGIWAAVGSRDEEPWQAGVSHFLEHLLFKGTEELTAQDVARILDRIGGESNAFTTREATAYWVRALSEDLETALSILLDIVARPALRNEDVETERSVMLEEMYQHLDEPSDVAWEKFVEKAFPNSPLGRDVQGSVETIAALSRDQIAAFWEEKYRRPRLVLAASGDVEHEALLESVDKAFSSRGGEVSIEREAPEDASAAVVMTERDTEQVHIVMGMRSVSTKDPRRAVVSLYNQILGGSMSSRLFQEVREKRGLVYHVHSEWAGFTDSGVLVVVASSSPQNAPEVVKLIKEQIASLRDGGFSEEEFSLAKAHLKADTVLASEDSLHRMNRIAASLVLRGEVKELEELVRQIEEVSPEQVGQIAGEVGAQPLIISAVGRKEALERLSESL